MKKRDKIYINPAGIRFPRITDKQCQKMHAASLEILERVGVRLHLDEAVQILKKAGAAVAENNLVRIPAKLVEKALRTAPNKLDLFDRSGNLAMSLQDYCCYYGPGSDCLNIIDHRTDGRRKPLLQDVIAGVTLCDYLPNIDFVMSMLLPSDVDATIADRYQMEAMLSYTTKPVVFVSYEFEGCKDCVEMAEAVVGSPATLRQYPAIACYINVPTGLLHNKDSLQKLLFLAVKNLPVMYIPSSTAGVTSPVTPASSVALDNAGVMVGLVLSQLVQEGAPFVIAGMPPGYLDMRTLVLPYCEPERGLIEAMAHFYGLPMFSLGGVSESKVVDQQAAAEATLSLLITTLAGGHIIHDVGYLESGLTFSFTQLVICHEIINWIKTFARGFEINEETLALDEIARAGPEGQYLNSKYTLNHYRDRWYPEIFERYNYESWARKGGKNLAARAAEKVEQILAEHKPEPLPAKVKEKLRKIVERAKTV